MAGDKTYITDNQGKLHRATRVHAVTPTDIVWSSNPNDYTVQVKIDGKWHRAVLTMNAGSSTFFDNINIGKALVTGADGKQHTALIVKPESTVTLSDIKTDTHGTIAGTTTGETAVSTYSENWSDVKWQDNVNVYKVLVTGSDGKVHTALLTTSAGGAVQVIVLGTSPLLLPDAIANSLSYVKAFGGTEQRNIPQPYTQVNYVTNTASTAVDTGVMIDFAKNYEFEVECRAVSGSWYILQSRASASGNITGIHGATSGNTITLVVGNVTVCTSAITRTVGNKLYVKATLNAGTATLYVKDETANTEDTQTGSYGTSQPNPTASVYLLGNAGGQYVDVNSDIYMARIKENDTVVMDYVPARQVATAGFYDKASGTFKTAKTPANLSADGNTVPTPDVPMDIVSNNGVLKARYSNGVPMGYKNVEYISYIGGAIETGVSGFDDETSEIYFRWKTDTIGVAANYQSVLFAWESNSYNSWRMLTYLQETDRWYLYGNSRSPVRISMSENIVHDINIKSGVVTVDGVDYNTTVTEDKTPSSTSLKIGSSGLNNYYYNIKVKRQGQIIADFVPVVRLTDGRAGLYDVVRNLFATAYSCVAGPDVSVPLEIYTDGTVETIEDTIGNTATTEMLLKVGDYQDEQEILSGAVTRKVGVMVLDGTENWEAVSATNPYFRAITNIPTPSYNIRPVNELCTHCVPKQIGGSNTEQSVCISLRTATDQFLYLFGRFDDVCVASSANISVWKQWLASQCLAGTPVIIVYPLATSTTESVAGQTLQVQNGDNTLEITQASLTGLELEAQYIKVV